MPFALTERKPGLTPGEFRLKSGTMSSPALLVVDHAQIRQMDQDFKTFMMDVDKLLVAKDICQGYQLAQIGYGPESMPGLIWVEEDFVDGESDTAVDKFKKKYMELLIKAEEKQDRWFSILVKLADDEWALKPLHRNISDLHRMACRQLNLERAWLSTDTVETMRCPACMQIVSKAAAVCFACKNILDVTAYAKLKFANTE